NAGEIDSPMLLEMLILNRSYSIKQNPRTLLIRHQDAALQREAADELPVVRINFRHHIGTIRFQSADFRQIALVNEEQPRGSAEKNRAEKQKCQRDSVYQFPTAQPQGDRGKTQHEILF